MIPVPNGTMVQGSELISHCEPTARAPLILTFLGLFVFYVAMMKMGLVK